MTLLNPTKEFLYGTSEKYPLHINILAAMFSGGFAITIANPTDTVKVKLMS